jgi:rhomboid family GlyGly-CTERM serine protease
VQIWGDAQWLRYQRTMVQDGELWRLFSANFIHLGWSHLTMNMAGLALIYILVGEQFTAWQWLLITLLCSLGVGVGLLLLSPQLAWYVGFSGVLHGLLVAGTTAVIGCLQGGQRIFGVVLLVCVIGKLVWEQLAGGLPGLAAISGGAVVVDAHLYGTVVGLGCGGVWVFARGLKAQQQRSR